MKNKIKYTIFLILILVILNISSSQNYTQNYISTDKTTYNINDTVQINLSLLNYSDIELSIASGSNIYRYLGMPGQSIRFNPRKTGNYTIEITNLSNNELIFSQNFSVIEFNEENRTLEEEKIKDPEESKELSLNETLTAKDNKTDKNISILTNKKNYLLGETVNISIGPKIESYHILYIVHENDVYRFLGVPEQQLIFIPKNIGDYYIQLIDNNQLIAFEQFSVDSHDADKKVVILNNTNLLLYSDKKEISNISMANISLNLTKKVNITKVEKIDIRNISKRFILKNYRKEKIRDYNLKFFKNKKPIKEILENETYDVEFNFSFRKIKKILFHDLKIMKNRTFDLGIDDMSKQKIKIKGKGVINSFAIDPTGLNFTSAIVSVVAEGSELWKCRDWNFSEQRCYGEWQKIIDIIPGHEYNITLTPEDPGYAETGLASINTKKSLYHPGETAELIMVVLDIEGHLVSNAAVYLNITDPDNNIYSYSTSNNEIIETLPGIYEANFTSTNLEGNYSMDVYATAEYVNSSLNSYFIVKEYYEFDILRQTPVTVDPWQGPFNSSIKIVSFTNATVFNFSEVLPINFTINNSGGAIIREENNKKILTWQNIANNSVVSYSALPPLITPELYELTSFVTYRDKIFSEGKNFIEARPWYLAIDPTTISDDNNMLANNTVLREGEIFTVTVQFDVSRQGTPILANADIRLEEGQDIDGNDQSGRIITDSCVGANFSIIGRSWNCPDGDVTCSNTSTNNYEINVEADRAATDQTITFTLQVCTGASASSPYDIGTEETQNVATVTFDDYINNIIVNPPIPPTWSNQKTNDSLIYQGEDVMLNVTWSDEHTLSNWIFSTNLSGEWVNTSPTLFTSTPQEVFNTTHINQTSGFAVGWRFYANDSYNLWNETDIFTFTVLGVRWNNTASYDFGTIEAGSVSEYNRDIIANGANTNIQLSCSGDCDVIGHNFSNGADLNDGDRATIKFNCSANKIGTFSTSYAVYSNEDTINDNITITCIIQDTTPPVWYNNQTNDTFIYQGETVQFNVSWNDAVALNYSWFSTNLSGDWNNYTPQQLYGRSDTAAYSLYINQTSGFVMGWRFYANDSLDYLNQTNLFTFIVLGIRWNDSSLYDFGQIQTDSLAEYDRDIIVDGSNTNVQLSCSGDCDVIGHNFSNGDNLNNGDIVTVKFNCSSSDIGTYSVNYSIFSNEDSVHDNISLICKVAGDIEYPAWSNNKTYPSMPVNYSTTQNYQFNVTWNDNVAIANAMIEHNFTGELKNYSVQNISNEFFYNVDTLAAGTYVWRFYANDTTGNTNYTDQWIYIVNKTNSIVNLTLNSSDSDIYINLGETVNITGKLIKPGSGTVYIYENGGEIYSGDTPLINTRQYDSSGTFNITVVYPENQNYTNSIDSLLVIVSDTIKPIVTLNSPDNNSYLSLFNVSFYFTPSDNIGLKNATLWANFSGIWTTNESNQSLLVDSIANIINVTNIEEGDYIWNVLVYDTSNNSDFASSNYTLTIDRTSPTKVTLLKPPDKSISDNQNPLLNWTETIEAHFKNYTIEVDNDPGFGSINYKYRIFNISNTTYQVEDNWDGGSHWYWRVTAYDKAGNSNISAVFNYTVDIEAPSLTLITDNNSYSNTLTNTLRYTVDDFTNVTNCSLVINYKLNQTNSSVTKAIPQDFTVTFSNEQSFFWSINCTDEAGNTNATETRVFIIDTSLPNEFNLTLPENYTISNDQLPLFNWSNSSDQNFANYTLLIDDDPNFGSSYKYYTFNVSNTSYQLTSTLSQDIWYWRVIAYDKAGNSRNSTDDFIYIVDITPPSDFSLIAPPNKTASTNNTPFLNWSETVDDYFANYTVYVDDDIDFGSINYSYSTFNITNTSLWIDTPWTNNTIWYWYVAAYDLAGNTKNSTDIFIYITDNTEPSINLSYPENNSEKKSSVVEFGFNVTDLSDISDCSLIVDGSVRKTETYIEKDIIQTMTDTFTNGLYNWRINCTDAAGNTNASETRLLNVNVSLPAYRFYETAAGADDLTAPLSVNLSTVLESPNEITYTDVPSSMVNYNNATSSTMSNISAYGFIIPPSTAVTFSNYIDLAPPDTYGTINWQLFKVNSSGEYLICQRGEIQLTSKTYQAYTGTCITPNYQIFINTSEQIKVVTNVTGAQGSNKPIMKQIDHPLTYVEIQGYALGNLTATLVKPDSDPKPGEDEDFNLSCKLDCILGYCLETNVYAQFNTSTIDWKDISTDPSDNIILNTSQVNPAVLGTFNGSQDANFSLLGNNLSYDNNIRCFATSIYSNSTTSAQNVSVLDKTAPNVSLDSPAPGYATAPKNITFSYIPKDKYLKNCSLYGNFSGTWQLNQTNTSPISEQTNYFQPIYLSYGRYNWNVKCFDTSGNSNFSSQNRTLIIAGDLFVNSSDIEFSKENPVGGENITINATIHNLADKNETDILIRFYEGDPDDSGTQINDDIIVNISALSNVTVNVGWIVRAGNFSFFVKVDPENNITESNENNNKANRSLSISAYHVYYGKTGADIRLDSSSANMSLFAWLNQTNTNGSIYIVDSDSSINWMNLLALGRNDTNDLQPDDWDQADILLNMTNLTDSLNRTYTFNTLPRNLKNFNVRGSTIIDVSFINSTNTSDFITGILWDRGDSETNNYYDEEEAEDLVFVTEINQNKEGRYGVYDYEIKVPATLREYVKPNNDDSLTFYVEIT